MVVIKKIFLFSFLMCIGCASSAQTDSVVIYYRAFAANHHFIYQDFHKVKEFTSYKKVITDKCQISRIQKGLKKVKKYDKNTGIGSILLGAFRYNNGNEVPYFYILNFDRLVFREKVYKYNDKFLRVLFPEKYNKELKRVIIGGYKKYKFHPDDPRYQE
jgi:hypothetical protein